MAKNKDVEIVTLGELILEAQENKRAKEAEQDAVVVPVQDIEVIAPVTPVTSPEIAPVTPTRVYDTVGPEFFEIATEATVEPLPKVSVTLLKDATNPLLLQLSFKNNTDKELFVTYQKTGLTGKFINSYFVTEPKLKYTGVVTKKSPFTLKDFIPLAPDEEIHSAWFNISDFYDISEVEIFNVKYQTSHQLTGKTTATVLTSNTVEINLTPVPPVEEKVVETPVVTDNYDDDDYDAEVTPEKKKSSIRKFLKALEDKANSKNSNKFWLTISAIATTIAIFGTIIFAIPVILFSVIGIVAGIISVKRQELYRVWTLASIGVSTLLLVASLLIYSIIVVLVAFAGVLTALFA
jgi:hypothetical protein